MDAFAVVFHPDFAPEFRMLDLAVKEALGEVFDQLRDTGPHLGRPQVDTLVGSRHANMKEIRVRTVDAVWRVAFAFDPAQQAIVLCGSDKSGISQQRFYRGLIALADQRLDAWLER